MFLTLRVFIDAWFCCTCSKDFVERSRYRGGSPFLPHGVRVFAFYFLGWRAAFYLVPASYLMMVLSVQAGIELDPWAVIVSPAACYIGFELVTRLLPEKHSTSSGSKMAVFWDHSACKFCS